jgi:putative RecB family exonuclease
VIYSYSKLRAFETCPLKFRYRYLDRVPTDLETIEAYTGKRVHEVLEALFRALAADPRPPELGEVLALYDEAWERAWHPQVEVVKETYTPNDYRRLGNRCLTTFYRGNWPFASDRTLALETPIEFDLDLERPDGPRVKGILDRVARGVAGELLIHDYKTSTYLPRQQEILADLQLAIYQLGAARRWPGAPGVKLIWHFLAFGRRVTVRLGPTGIEEKQAVLARRIEAIAEATAARSLPARVSPLCAWCSYRRLCPAYAAQGGPPAVAPGWMGKATSPAGGRAAPAARTAPPAPAPAATTPGPLSSARHGALRLRPLGRRLRKRPLVNLAQLQLF